jgi:integron integrase
MTLNDMPSTSVFDRLRFVAREQGKALSTERSYAMWLKRFMAFHPQHKPEHLGHDEVISFLTHLADHEKVSAATQNNALSALLFFLRTILLSKDPKLDKIKRPKIRPNEKEVLSESEVLTIITCMEGVHKLMLKLIYGAGLSMVECLRLRTQDLTFERSQVFVRHQSKKGRWSLLPKGLHQELKEHLKRVKNLHLRDLQQQHGFVKIPEGEDPKLPDITLDWQWQWLFPAKSFSKDPRSGRVLRHHAYKDRLTVVLRKAVEKSGTYRKVNIRIFQASFANHLLCYGYDVRTVQALLGHRDGVGGRITGFN